MIGELLVGFIHLIGLPADSEIGGYVYLIYTYL